MINVFQPSLGAEELARIKGVFESNWLGKGKLNDEFELGFAAHLKVDRKHVFTTNCCSEGLFASMHMFDIGPGDEVIMPTISFVGAGNAVCASGAKLALCDVDPRTLNVRARDIETKITPNTKAIMLIHYGGVPCEMDEIMALAEKHHLYVIEDSACSVSSTYKGQACGTIGDMGMWSFDAMKILVCGDGSMLYFRDPELKVKAEKWLYFGLESKSGYSNSVDKKWWEYDVSSFGHRAIMNDITAAMAVEQLKKLPGFITKRKAIHEEYDRLLADVSWLDTPLPLAADCTSSYYFYHVQVKKAQRDDLAKYLREHGVYTTFRYFPLHRVSRYEIKGNFPNADYAAEHTLCLPLHQSLSMEDVATVVRLIHEFGRINHLNE
ncbi:DegT/DnrJ/EryC1/StrS family aminotransferase [Pyramidobacter sp. YE332]|uniref:DegT/DnrJ/EryC1/StrS family aminotransferase n=1 Tax=Pyramidobacter sp. YE332 TaxID=3068894 RepID=UPI00294B1B4D|nr:DegT/DnrJ/EryC1/StrS family aminotransferase [Pyramidobacter sp. YE332]WOL38940.1 DegT/DnrJ/EryC1/StrS family aminotransferase [Pyramidobacter sp. YE332]